MKSLQKDNKGMTLIELMVAIFILAIIIVPLFLAFATSAKTTYRSREIADATLTAENIAEYLISSDFYSESVTSVVTGMDSTFGVTGTSAYIDNNSATTPISDSTLLFGDITEDTSDTNNTVALDTFQIIMSDIQVETTTLDAVITLDRVEGEASDINAVLLTDSAQASLVFVQSKEDGVTSDPDSLSFQDFISAAKLAGIDITNSGNTILSYDDETISSLCASNVLDADRNIEIDISKVELDSETAEWEVNITYSYTYTYSSGGTTFSKSFSYDVISDDFDMDMDEEPNIQVLFYPWYHGDEVIDIRNNNEIASKEATFNLYLAKQKHDVTDNTLSSWEATYGNAGNKISVNLYNDKSLDIEPDIYSNMGTRFIESSGTGAIISGTSYYKIYQLEYFYSTSEFISTESLLEESTRNRYYNITIELTLDGETESIYELETTKLQ